MTRLRLFVRDAWRWSACHYRLCQRGFTLVELIVVVPVFIMTIAVLVTVLVTMYVNLVKNDAGVELAVESQNALSSIQDDLYFARNFADHPSAIMVDADAPGGDSQNWTYDTAPSSTLIVYEIATDKIRQDPTRSEVFQKTSASGFSCDPNNIELNPPVLNNLIYYVSSGQLKRRVLVPDPTQSRCSEPYRIQSCSPHTTRVKQTLTGPQTVACPQDSILASDVASFSVNYYDANNDLVDFSAGGSPLQAERIDLKLSLKRTVAADTVSYNGELNITKINTGDPHVE